MVSTVCCACWLLAALAHVTLSATAAQNQDTNFKRLYSQNIGLAAEAQKPEGFLPTGHEFHAPLLSGPRPDTLQIQMAKNQVTTSYIDARFAQVRDTLLRIDARIEHVARSTQSSVTNPALNDIRAAVSATNVLLATLSFRKAPLAQRQIHLQTLLAKVLEIFDSAKRLQASSGVDDSFLDEIANGVGEIEVRVIKVDALLQQMIIEKSHDNQNVRPNSPYVTETAIPTLDFGLFRPDNDGRFDLAETTETTSKEILPSVYTVTETVNLPPEMSTKTITIQDQRSTQCPEQQVVTKTDILFQPLLVVTLTDVRTSSITVTGEVVTEIITLPGTTMTEIIQLNVTKTLPIETITQLSTHFIAVSDIADLLGTVTDTLTLLSGTFSKDQTREAETIEETVTVTRFLTLRADRNTLGAIALHDASAPVATVTVMKDECACPARETVIESSTMHDEGVKFISSQSQGFVQTSESTLSLRATLTETSLAIDVSLPAASNQPSTLQTDKDAKISKRTQSTTETVATSAKETAQTELFVTKVHESVVSDLAIDLVDRTGPSVSSSTQVSLQDASVISSADHNIEGSMSDSTLHLPEVTRVSQDIGTVTATSTPALAMDLPTEEMTPAISSAKETTVISENEHIDHHDQPMTESGSVSDFKTSYISFTPDMVDELTTLFATQTYGVIAISALPVDYPVVFQVSNGDHESTSTDIDNMSNNH